MSETAFLRSRDRLLERALRLEGQEPAEKTIGLVERVLEQFPDDIEASLIKARLLIRLGQLDLAHDQLAHLVERAPDAIEVRLTFVGTLLCSGRYNEAIDHLQTAVHLCECDPLVDQETAEQQLKSLWHSYMESPKR